MPKALVSNTKGIVFNKLAQSFCCEVKLLENPININNTSIMALPLKRFLKCKAMMSFFIYNNILRIESEIIYLGVDICRMNVSAE